MSDRTESSNSTKRSNRIIDSEDVLIKRLSEEERRADALALRAEERRDKLRKAAGRSKYPTIRGCLNGETRMEDLHAPYHESIVVRGEPGELKHLSSRRKRKQP